MIDPNMPAGLNADWVGFTAVGAAHDYGELTAAEQSEINVVKKNSKKSAIKEAEVEPCIGCKFKADCTESKLSCSSFILFTNKGGNIKRSEHDMPTGEKYSQLFNDKEAQ